MPPAGWGGRAAPRSCTCGGQGRRQGTSGTIHLWFKHNVAVARLHAAWLAWQELTDPATCGYTGPSVWHRDHLDPVLRELRGSSNPFAGCVKGERRLPSLVRTIGSCWVQLLGPVVRPRRRTTKSSSFPLASSACRAFAHPLPGRTPPTSPDPPDPGRSPPARAVPDCPAPPARARPPRPADHHTRSGSGPVPGVAPCALHLPPHLGTRHLDPRAPPTTPTAAPVYALDPHLTRTSQGPG
ncbi:DUF4913 domain-containing protein [Streptomyces sp. NPDC085942]|uniref:DUF4913 domain-containing protein n=1 Tax=Streptomyces sp. NPDC085942 TaxID=3365743 RepID=UPI0037D238CD